MWLLRGDLHEHQIGSAGGPTKALTIWLRPDRIYRFGRQHKEVHNDFAWAEPKSASRKHVELRSGPTSRAHVRISPTQTKPTYSVTIKNLTKKTWTVVHTDGSQISILADGEYTVVSGDEICFTTPTRKAIFLWQPLDLLYTLTRRVDDVEQFAMHSGCRYLDSKTYTDHPFTHMIAKVLNLRATVARALVEQRHIVSIEWFTRLQRACMPRRSLPETDPDFAVDDNFSILERDYDAAWPREAEAVPDAQVDDVYGARDHADAAPKEARKSVFSGILVVDTVADDLSGPWMDVLMLAGAETLSCPLGPDDADIVGSISNAVERHGTEKHGVKRLPCYLHITVGLPADMLDLMRQASARNEKLPDIQEAIYRADRASMHVDSCAPRCSTGLDKPIRNESSNVLAPSSSDDPMDDAHEVPEKIINVMRRVLAPPSSVMDMDDPLPIEAATQKVDGAASSLEVDDARIPEDMAPPPLRKPLVRRVGQRDSLLDSIFGPDPPHRASSESEANLGTSSAAQMDAIQGSSPAMASSLGPTSFVPSMPVGTSRTARLKRRAGEVHGYSFGFDAAAPPARLSNAHSQPQRDQQPATSLPSFNVQSLIGRQAGLVAMSSEGVHEVGGTGTVTDMTSAGGDALEQPRKKTRRVVTDETEHVDPPTEPVESSSRHVDKGKRKVKQKERELDKVFDKLKLVKPVLIAPKVDSGRQVAWRDRDLDEEEFAENRRWQYDPDKSFFNIVRAPLGRTNPAPSRLQNDDLPDKWGHRPNYKAFRPVRVSSAAANKGSGHTNLQKSHSALPIPSARRDIGLALPVLDTFGLMDGDIDSTERGRGKCASSKRGNELRSSPASSPTQRGSGRIRSTRSIQSLDPQADGALIDSVNEALVEPGRSGNINGRGKASKKAGTARTKTLRNAANIYSKASQVASIGSRNVDLGIVNGSDDGDGYSANLGNPPVAHEQTGRKRRERVIDHDSEDELKFGGFGRKSPAKRRKG